MRAKTIFASRAETNETSDISVHMQRATLRCREPKYRASHTASHNSILAEQIISRLNMRNILNNASSRVAGYN